MSTSNPTNMTLTVTLYTTALVYFAHHTYQFDKWRCLVPRKKDWFRLLLTYMLIMSFTSLLIWSTGWTYIKYKLGWMIVPGMGAMPFPNQLWSEKYKKYNLPLTFFVNFAYWIQVSLNAEEGLYWYHLMRAVRRPKSAGAWLSSSFFYTWIGVSISAAVIQFGISWIHYEDMIVQSGRMYTGAGVIELVVVLASTIVIFKFPAFLRDVRASGAGPEVRSRLHFYHEANKVRTFFRILFASGILILGVDGLTESKRINLNHIASDAIQQICFGSFFLANIVSIILYLPRNWSGSTNSARVMVGAPGGGDQAFSPRNPLASNALMSLLREGGQWDEVDDALTGHPGSGKIEGKAFDELYKEAWEHPGSPRAPRVLEEFTSPFAVQTTEELPTQIRIHIEQEVHKEDGSSARVPFSYYTPPP